MRLSVGHHCIIARCLSPSLPAVGHLLHKFFERAEMIARIQIFSTREESLESDGFWKLRATPEVEGHLLQCCERRQSCAKSRQIRERIAILEGEGQLRGVLVLMLE